MAKFPESNTSLRKKYPRPLLGFHERDILNGPGAKSQRQEIIKIVIGLTRGSSFFVFTYKKPGFKDFTVVS